MVISVLICWYRDFDEDLGSNYSYRGFDKYRDFDDTGPDIFDFCGV